MQFKKIAIHWKEASVIDIKIRKNWVPASSYEGLIMRPKRKEFGCDLWIIVCKLVSFMVIHGHIASLRA